jgi:hypothetical protein
MISAEFEAGVAAEFVDAELGDSRLGRRLTRIVERVSRDPSSSFPTAMETSAETEAFYRFMSNPWFDSADMLMPHVEATLARAQSVGEIACIHDTSNIDYPGESRVTLGATGAAKHQGYLAHVSFAARIDVSRTPLGVLALETYTRTGRKKRKKGSIRAKSARTALDPNRESQRWWRGVEQVEELAGNSFKVIHIADAEADFFELLAKMCGSQYGYIVRAGQLDRVTEHAGRTESLRNVLDAMQPQASRTIELSERKNKGRQQPREQRERHPPRAARHAEIAVAATTVRLRRTRYCDVDAQHIDVNVVRVWEPKPPDGEPAVEWVLFTSEPIGKPTELKRIVDLYRLRWLIEEFFKALKTGCALEKRQLESYDALCKVLALFIPIAYRLLLLRGIEDTAPSTHANVVFTATELHVLTKVHAAHRVKKPRRVKRPITVGDAIAMIARLGGHLKHNGRPGWQVLGRGYEKLLAYCAGYEIGRVESARKLKNYDQS